MPSTDRGGAGTATAVRPVSPVKSGPAMMKAIAVLPGKPNSMHLGQLPKPSVDDIPGGRGVLVKVLRVGVDGTDKEINAAEYGMAPPGYDFLVTGHESFGRVEAVGPNVSECQLSVGDYVVATVRRPGSSIYDRIGTYDMTTDDVYYERGINLLHGYLTEYYVDDPEYIVRVPAGLRNVGVLLEPTTVVEKGIAQAYEIQRRLRVWRPHKVAVMGAGTIGLLAALALRLRGLDVTVFGRTPRPYLNSDLIEALGARYLSTAELPIVDGAGKYGPFDLIFEATGASLGGVREHAGPGQERRAGALQRHRRRPHDPGAGRPDQPRVRARQQGDGRDGQREPGILRVGREGPGAGRGAVPRVAGSAPHPPGEGTGELEAPARHPDQRQGSHQGLLRGRGGVAAVKP